jgi:hypothetical protein
MAPSEARGHIKRVGWLSITDKAANAGGWARYWLALNSRTKEVEYYVNQKVLAILSLTACDAGRIVMKRHDMRASCRPRARSTGLHANGRDPSRRLRSPGC